MSTPDVETMRAEQSKRILDQFEDWLAGAPGRSVRLSRGEDGTWLAALDETHQGRGESLRDAAGQCAQILAMGGAS